MRGTRSISIELDTDAVLDAMIQSFSGNEEPLRILIQELIV